MKSLGQSVLLPSTECAPGGAFHAATQVEAGVGLETQVEAGGGAGDPETQVEVGKGEPETQVEAWGTGD